MNGTLEFYVRSYSSRMILNGTLSCIILSRSTMAQLGLVLSEDDIHAMMKSVGIGPHGKISFSGK